MMGRTPKDIKDAVLAGSNFVVADMLEAAEALQKLRRPMVTRQLLSPFSCLQLGRKADASVEVDASLL